jgi:two-component system, chemotaxis family, protein-glutamate methylesterase/glutaminase
MLQGQKAAATIRVLVVDDSSFMRNAIIRHIQRDTRFSVVGTAANGREAVAKAAELRPDVITMDVEMPEMDGIEALRQIHAKSPIPIIMVSSQTEAGAKTTMQALNSGAMDFIPKAAGFEQLHEKLHAVVGAARARVAPPRPRAVAPGRPMARREGLGPIKPKIVVIGSSTGGPRALHQVLERLPARFPAPIVIAQHMPPQFTAAMAKWLSDVCPIKIVEAADDMLLAPGVAYVGPGGMQFRVVNGRAKIAAAQGESLYKPSVDILADSAAACYGGHVLAIMLTGMGNDGARAFAKLKGGGAYVMAQDQTSSAVWGMPRAVVESGGADEILGVGDIGARICALFGLA